MRAAVGELINTGAGFDEIHNLAMHYAHIGKTSVALDFLDKAPAADAVQEMEKTVSRYVIIAMKQGELKATQFLADSVPHGSGKLLAQVLYTRGLLEPILAEFLVPELHPAGSRERVWLYRAAAWMALGKKLRFMGDLLALHYKEGYQPEGGPEEPSQQIEAVYHAAGRYLMGNLTEEELLEVSSDPGHRCVFTYYIGFRMRMNENYTGSTRWYQLCRKTLDQGRLEYRWAAQELAWWKQSGLRNRNRLWSNPLGARFPYPLQAMVGQESAVR
jgi:hypothetical protein